MAAIRAKEDQKAAAVRAKQEEKAAAALAKARKADKRAKNIGARGELTPRSTVPSPPSPQPWAAPLAPAPIRATVSVPGSKSQTNRALVLAALASGQSVIRNGLNARDTELMDGLRELGVQITAADHQWRVTP